MFGLGPDGKSYIRRVAGDEDVEDIFDLWLVLSLSHGELAELRNAFGAVMARFENRRGPGGRPYLFRAAAAPRLEDR